MYGEGNNDWEDANQYVKKLKSMRHVHSKTEKKKNKRFNKHGKKKQSLTLADSKKGKRKGKVERSDKDKGKKRDYGDYEDMVDLVCQAPLVHEDQPDMFQRADKWEDTLVDQDAGKNSTIKRVH